MKIIKLTLELATLDDCGSDDITKASLDMTADGKICFAHIVSEETLFAGEKPAKASPKKSRAGLTPADSAGIVSITTPNLLKPKRKYTRRAKAKVVPGDVPAYERTPKGQTSGSTVVKVNEDGTKTEIRK